MVDFAKRMDVVVVNTYVLENGEHLVTYRTVFIDGLYCAEREIVMRSETTS